jgi:hypothetical protein
MGADELRFPRRDGFMKNAVRRVVAAWLFAGAVGAVLSGLMVVSTPSNQSSMHRLVAFSLELVFAALLAWAGLRLWRGISINMPAVFFFLLAVLVSSRSATR